MSGEPTPEVGDWVILHTEGCTPWPVIITGMEDGRVTRVSHPQTMRGIGLPGEFEVDSGEYTADPDFTPPMMCLFMPARVALVPRTAVTATGNAETRRIESERPGGDPQ